MRIKMNDTNIRTLTDLLKLRENSEHTAVVCGTKALTFRQLAEDARQIAEHLKKNGVRKGDRVLLTLSDSLNVMRAVYGVMLAGGVYVSVSADWPEERFKLAEEETKASLRLTDEMVSGFLSQTLLLSSLPEIREEEEAAVYYTSGSTGKPKGFVLCHKTLMAYTCGDERAEDFLRRERFLCFPVFSAILTAIVIFLLTAYEKTLVFTTGKEMQSAELLVECMLRNRIDSMGGIPSFLLRILMYPPFADVVKKQVKHFWVGGEPVSEANAQKLLDAMEDGDLNIGYGSTETYLISLLRYSPGTPVQLGRIPKGANLFVGDEKGNPVPAGMSGEILIGGVPAKYGRYLDPDLDRQRYFNHPSLGRLFRTNDAGRLFEDGTIQIIGRIDRMIKLHGQRIEPGEIEAVMERFPGIQSAAVTLRKEQLCAYFTAACAISEPGLRRFLSEQLPHYMIPSRLMQLKAMPLSTNRKIDYNALPEPKEQATTQITEASGRESVICSIFQEVLQLKNPVSPEDSFFALGGDSIHALAAAGLLAEEGLQMELSDLFANPTPKLLSGCLFKRSEQEETELPFEASPLLESDEIEAVYPVTVHVADRYLRRGAFYPFALLWELDDPASEEVLEARIEKLSKAHDSLRSELQMLESGEVAQVFQRASRTKFFHADLRKLSSDSGISSRQKHYLSALVRMDTSSSSELGKNTSLRLGLIRISDTRTFLYTGFSHYFLDGVGITILLRELLSDTEIFPDRARMQRRIQRLYGTGQEKAKAYWDTFFKHAKAPVSFPKGTADESSEEKKFFYLPGGKRLYETLKETAAERETTLSVLMTYSIGKALLKLQNTKEALFLTMGTGRNSEEMQLPGMFTVSFPVCLKETDTPDDLKKQLMESDRYAWFFSIPEHALPFREDILNLNVQNIAVPKGVQPVPFTEIDNAPLDSEKSIMKGTFEAIDTPLEIQAYPDGRFGFMGWCKPSRFDAASLETLLKDALKVLKSLV